MITACRIQQSAAHKSIWMVTVHYVGGGMAATSCLSFPEAWRVLQQWIENDENAE